MRGEHLAKPWRLAIFVAGTTALLALFGLYCFKILDPDFGWHLTAGQYILAHGVPQRDIFSYTASNFRWIDHEWLSDVIVAKVYGLGGFGLLAWLFAGLWTLGTILASRRYNFAVLILAALALEPYAGVRTVVWTFLGLAILERLLESKRSLVLATIVPLMLLWANLHGSFVIAFAVLAYHFWVSRDRRLLVILVASVLVSFINPYGPRLYIEVARTLFDAGLHWRIIEWRPFGLMVPTLAYVLPLIALVFIVKPKPWRWFLSLPGLFLAMALSSSRHSVLLIAGTIRHFEELSADLARKLKSLDLNRLQIVIVGLAALAITIAAAFFSVEVALAHNAGEAAYPAQAAAYLRARPCSGQVFNDYDYGGYLIWRVPGEKTYIDGRMPSWRSGSTNYLTDYARMLTDQTFRRQQFRLYGISCAVVMRPSGKHPDKALANQLQREGWTTAALDPGSVLLLAPRP